jgi:O-antigen ligase
MNTKYVSTTKLTSWITLPSLIGALVIGLVIGLAIPFFNIGVLVLLLPAAILLILKPDWGFYLFIASLPLEYLIDSTIYSIPKVLGLVAMAGFVLDAILRRRRIYGDAALGLMLLFVGWGMLSYLWSAQPSQTLISITTWSLLAMLYFLIINQVRTAASLHKTITAFFLGSALLVGSGVNDLVTGAYLSANQQRLTGLTDNANVYATYVLVGVIGIYWVWMNNRSKLVRAFTLAVAGALGVTIVMTLSRGAIVSLAVFGLMLVLLRKDRSRWILLVSLAALLMALLAPSNLWERFLTVGSDTIDRFRDLWPAGLALFQKNSILGYGLGAGPYVFANTYLSLNYNLLEQFSVHSAPLAVAVDVGIPGLLIYLAFIALPTIQLAKTYFQLDEKEKNNLLGGFAAIVLSVLAAYLVSWVKGGGMEVRKMLWLLLGLETCVTFLLQQQHQKTISNGDKAQTQ